MVSQAAHLSLTTNDMMGVLRLIKGWWRSCECDAGALFRVMGGCGMHGRTNV